MSTEKTVSPVRVQQYIAFLSVVLFIAKMLAFYFTHSVTVLTDALEGVVNMIAGFLGLFCIILAAMPRDTNHPYGHGKAEFLSSAVEGTLIILSSFVVIYEAIIHLMRPHQLEKLDTGLVIIIVCGLLNYGAGVYAGKKGKNSNSLILMSAGKHLKTDGYSTVAVIIGLSLLIVTGNRFQWLDSIVALCFALVIIYTGYKVLRKSIGGIMDEMDMVQVEEVIQVLQEKRQPAWVDLHNLRVIQYGSMMHMDAHMTLPFYYTVAEAGKQIEHLEEVIMAHFGSKVEFFIHIDSCMPYQCKLCSVAACAARKEPFVQQVRWEVANLWPDSKHGKGNRAELS